VRLIVAGLADDIEVAAELDVDLAAVGLVTSTW
jgi:hypothetical protein